MDLLNTCKPIQSQNFKNCSNEQLLDIHRKLVTIREAEEAIADLIAAKDITCPCHLYTGQEATAVGVCTNLTNNDFVYSTHRSHGHFLAKGGSTQDLFAEIYCSKAGCSGGRGGSMHLTAPDIGFPGSSAIVAGTVPLAVGSAWAFQLRNEPHVAVCFFGDGAMNEGVVYESLNMASLYKLPVIFVCENNLYCTHLKTAKVHATTDLHRKAEAFAMPGVRIDGNDVGEVYATASEAVHRARSGAGPTLIEAMTYRWRGHVGPNYDLDKGLRTQEELDSWVERCPQKRIEEYLVAQEIISPEALRKQTEDIRLEIEKAAARGKACPKPDPKTILDFVYAD